MLGLNLRRFGLDLRRDSRKRQNSTWNALDNYPQIPTRIPDTRAAIDRRGCRASFGVQGIGIRTPEDVAMAKCRIQQWRLIGEARRLLTESARAQADTLISLWTKSPFHALRDGRLTGWTARRRELAGRRVLAAQADTLLSLLILLRCGRQHGGKKLTAIEKQCHPAGGYILSDRDVSPLLRLDLVGQKQVGVLTCAPHVQPPSRLHHYVVEALPHNQFRENESRQLNQFTSKQMETPMGLPVGE